MSFNNILPEKSLTSDLPKNYIYTGNVIGAAIYTSKKKTNFLPLLAAETKDNDGKSAYVIIKVFENDEKAKKVLLKILDESSSSESEDSQEEEENTTQPLEWISESKVFKNTLKQLQKKENLYPESTEDFQKHFSSKAFSPAENLKEKTITYAGNDKPGITLHTSLPSGYGLGTIKATMVNIKGEKKPRPAIYAELIPTNIKNRKQKTNTGLVLKLCKDVEEVKDSELSLKQKHETNDVLYQTMI